MASTSLTGADVIQIDSRILTDLADGDCVLLAFPSDLAAVKASKNGNMIYSFNEQGKIVDVTLRVLVGSADDKWLHSRLQEMINDFSKFILLTGLFVKRTGDGGGNMANVAYQCAGGIFKRQVDAKTNSEGNPEQSVAIYQITYGNGGKTIS
jgi:hypothetical protein